MTSREPGAPRVDAGRGAPVGHDGAVIGLVAALAAALAFSLSGALLKPLLEAGWSPTAAVAVRVGVGGAVLAVPALMQLRADLRPLLRHWRLVLGYGLVAVAGTQVLYFAAIQRLPVAVALLIQYSAPVLLVLLEWARSRSRPAWVVLAGTVLSVVGLVLVVDPSGAGGGDVLGILLAFAAAVCLAGYYALSARRSEGLPPLALISAGLLVGSAATSLVGLTGLAPLTASTADVQLGAAEVPWWLPMAVVAVVATALAYWASLTGARRLGARVAAFVGLTEVVFAVLLAWLLLGERPQPGQLAGGVLLLAGVVLVRSERRRDAGGIGDAASVGEAAEPGVGSASVRLAESPGAGTPRQPQVEPEP